MTQRVVNYTYGTGNPVLPDGSIDVRDGIDNLQSLDIFMNAGEDTYNKRDGEVVQTVAGAIRSIGFKHGTGDFTTGFTVMPGQRDYAWYDPVSKNWYAYTGVIPTSGYTVAPGTNPVGNINWKQVTDDVLRADLAKPTGSSLIGFQQVGTGAVTRIAQDKMREVVSVKDFGAVGDGVTDDTAAIQAALDSGAATVSAGGAGVFLISNTLQVQTAGQIVDLSPAVTVKLVTENSALRVFDIAGSGAVVRGGRLTTTLRTLGFVVRLSGNNTKLVCSEVYFPSKSTLPPINGVDIPYNRGGVEVRGAGGEVVGCNIYNQEGAGVVTYSGNVVVRENRIHNNILGIHASAQAGEDLLVSIQDNSIFDNNVNHASGACGVLAAVTTTLILSGNAISGNGEHGTYIYSRRSTISNNVVSGNYRNGLKIRSSVDTVVSGNVSHNNNQMGEETSGDIVLQVQGEDVKGVSITGNIARNVNDSGAIRVAYIEPERLCEGLIVSGNQCDIMSVPFSTGVVVSGNIVKTDLVVGASLPTAPAVQSGALVCGNRAGTLQIGRCVNSTFDNNTVAAMGIASISPGNNRITNNTMTAQNLQISRGNFVVFSGNDINCAPLGSLSLLPQPGYSAHNHSKQIVGNRFRAHAERIINDSTSATSGSKYVLANNVFDSSVEGISMWGSGHSIIGNVNIGGGGTGYVGCNNSWMIGNSPKMGERAGTTGNQNI